MDNSQKTAYQAGETKGQTQEKAKTMVDKAGNVANSGKEAIQSQAAGATEAVKNATGMNKK